MRKIKDNMGKCADVDGLDRCCGLRPATTKNFLSHRNFLLPQISASHRLGLVDYTTVQLDGSTAVCQTHSSILVSVYLCVGLCHT